MTKSIIKDKSFEFSLEIISLYKILQSDKEFIISKQLLRSATSIGANVNEALAGQSKKEFTSKISLASKEARESKYWLQLLDKSQLVKLDFSKYLLLNNELIRILTAIVKTSQTQDLKPITKT